MADILRMIVGQDESIVTLGLKRNGQGFSTCIKRSAKPMPSGHTPVSILPTICFVQQSHNLKPLLLCLFLLLHCPPLSAHRMRQLDDGMCFLTN